MAMTLNQEDIDAIAAAILVTPANKLATGAGGAVTTVTNLTNAPTAGDLTAEMKSSVTAAVPTVEAMVIP